MSFAVLVEAIFVLTGIAHLCAVILLSVNVHRGWKVRTRAALSDPEDSEFAIRVHAAGYTSIFLRRAYGWGLIPGRTEEATIPMDLRAGQEFKAHVRLHLPGPLGVPSSLTWRQRLRHGHCGLVILMTGLRVLTVPISMVLMALMFLRQESPALAPALAVPFGAIVAARGVMRWTLYNHVWCRRTDGRHALWCSPGRDVGVVPGRIAAGRPTRTGHGSRLVHEPRGTGVWGRAWPGSSHRRRAHHRSSRCSVPPPCWSRCGPACCGSDRYADLEHPPRSPSREIVWSCRPRDAEGSKRGT